LEKLDFPILLLLELNAFTYPAASRFRTVTVWPSIAIDCRRPQEKHEATEANASDRASIAYKTRNSETADGEWVNNRYFTYSQKRSKPILTFCDNLKTFCLVIT
jgi:hypothetical protein